MRHKSHSLKEQRWTRWHWRRWDEETRNDRLAYEQKVEDRDNALIMAHIRGRKRCNESTGRMA
jgi:hypothetical protein